jgi:hypothetical protein
MPASNDGLSVRRKEGRAHAARRPIIRRELPADGTLAARYTREDIAKPAGETTLSFSRLAEGRLL